MRYQPAGTPALDQTWNFEKGKEAVTDFKKGDIVRVEYTTVFDRDTTGDSDTVFVGHPLTPGAQARVPRHALTLVRRANAPENDPVATYRIHPEDPTPFGPTDVYVKVGDNRWACLTPGDDGDPVIEIFRDINLTYTKVVSHGTALDILRGGNDE